MRTTCRPKPEMGRDMAVSLDSGWMHSRIYVTKVSWKHSLYLEGFGGEILEEHSKSGVVLDETHFPFYPCTCALKLPRIRRRNFRTASWK